MEELLSIIINYIQANGYAAIAVAAALESANIPIPSEIIFGFAGYLVYAGRLDFTLAIVVGVAGELAGAIVSYLAGRYGGRSLVLSYGKYILLSEKKLELTERWFDRYGQPAIFAARILPIVRTFISLPAGFGGVNFIKFVLLTATGSALWITLLVYLGQMLGTNWQVVYAVGHEAGLFVAVVLAVLIGYYLLRGRVSKNVQNE